MTTAPMGPEDRGPEPSPPPQRSDTTSATPAQQPATVPLENAPARQPATVPLEKQPTAGSLAAAGTAATSRASDAAPTGAPVPRHAPAVGWIGVLLALALTVLGVLAMFDGAVRAGWVDGGRPVLTPLLTGPATVTPQLGAAVVGGALALLGLVLLWLALKRGRQAGVQLGRSAGIWMSHSDLEGMVTSTAERCDGVLSASARASRKRVLVDLQTTTAEVQESAAAAVRERLAGLSAPDVVVRTSPRFERSAR